MHLTLDEINQLSPDEASTKAAKGLVIPSKWPRLGVSDLAFWGECQGSGSKPYQVQIDKNGPAFKCSCPSRKFPCKHGLALLFLWNQHQDKFSQSEAPSWVSDWLNSRQERVEKQAAKKAEPAKAVDPQAMAKREMAREQKMLAGLDELELWLKDQIRHGLAGLPNQPLVWANMASRMVDAQLPALSVRFQRFESLISQTPEWPEQILAEFGQLQLLIDGYRRINDLPKNIQFDLRTAVGVPIDKEQILNEGEQIQDVWWVLGQNVLEENRLWMRRLWLRGQTSGRTALLLDYSHGTRQFELTCITGTSLEMTLAFYPSNYPQRALVVAPPTTGKRHELPTQSLDAGLANLAAQLAATPWQWPLPFLVGSMIPRFSAAGWQLHATTGEDIPLQIEDQDGWQLVAESGGMPLNFFGEWTGQQLRPLSCWTTAGHMLWQEGGNR